VLGAMAIAVTVIWSGAAHGQQAAAERPAAKTDDKAEEKAPADESKAWETAPPEHRGGFTVGLAISAGLGASNGFPNDSKKIGRERYYTESGLGFAPSQSLWLGGAFIDWLTFGIGGGFSSIYAESTRTQSPLLLFHTDVYPLYPLGGQLRNLGAMTEFGIGFAETTDNETDEVLIDGSGASYIFAGAFWEGIEAWKLKMGPYTGVHYLFSSTIRRPVFAVGFRISLYSSP
jgi:hypothetical protein